MGDMLEVKAKDFFEEYSGKRFKMSAAGGIVPAIVERRKGRYEVVFSYGDEGKIYFAPLKDNFSFQKENGVPVLYNAFVPTPSVRIEVIVDGEKGYMDYMRKLFDQDG